MVLLRGGDGEWSSGLRNGGAWAARQHGSAWIANKVTSKGLAGKKRSKSSVETWSSFLKLKLFLHPHGIVVRERPNDRAGESELVRKTITRYSYCVRLQ